MGNSKKSKKSTKKSETKKESLDIKDIILINNYKTAMNKAQIEAIIEILIKNKITSYEEVWKKTNEIFKEMTKEVPKNKR